MPITQSTSNVGLTKVISVFYFMFGGTLVVASIFGFTISHTKLHWQSDAWLPSILMFSAIGTVRLTKWGRWSSYLFSILFLLAVPIGTLFGGYMLWHLTKFRSEFNKWY
jgi:hypothetical protein